MNGDFIEKKGQIAHLDHNASNPDFENLAYLCFNHHDEYDSTTRQSKGLTIGEAKKYRGQLYVAIEQMREKANTSLQQVKADFDVRVLSPQEETKVKLGSQFAYVKVNQYLEQGYIPRNDGFFDKGINGRSGSDEILEGVLFKCKNEHEERKLRFIGNIYANVVFMPDVSVAQANWLLQEVQNLTYRQLCIIAITEQIKHKSVSWGPSDGDPPFEIEYKQLDYMFQRDYSQDSVKSYEETGEGLWVVGLSRIGKLCYRIMDLKEIPKEDLQKLSRHFSLVFE